MPRRREVPKRDILPDPKYGNVEVAKFVNVLMTRGKKSIAEHIVYDAFDLIKSKSGKDPLEVFSLAVQNVKPVVEVKSRRVGGANYQVPVEVRPVRRAALSMRWLRHRRRGANDREDRYRGETGRDGPESTGILVIRAVLRELGGSCGSQNSN
jgi:small subunit ribosomal protein S7